MAYLGNQPVPQATQTRDRFVATSGQTSFATSGYTPQFIDVYLDGVKLDSTEYTATNGSDVVLDTGATTGQILEVVAFSAFDVADIRNMTQPLGLKNYTTTQRNALTNLGAGDTIYNSTTGSIEFYDGSSWIATNLIPTINSVTGTIYAGASSSLTLSITNATDSVTVRFTEGGATIEDVANVSVSSGSASVTVPSAVYGQTAGDTIAVSILNQDGTPSSNSITKTVVGLPTGGTVTTSGSYRYHTFTSSGNFVVPSGFSATAEYLLVAGGGAGGGVSPSGGYHAGGGGGGAGGMLTGSTSVSANTYGIVIGAGGSASSHVSNSGANTTALGLTANGGGRGSVGGTSEQAANGGSGGGGGRDINPAGSGTSGQGNSGGVGNSGANSAAGGGGKSQSGFNPSSSVGGDGGDGAVWPSGGSTYYAGGGAGGNGNTNSTSTVGQGGLGGGGNGARHNVDQYGNPGTANTGGGGGGGAAYTSAVGTYGGAGGSGIVKIRYQLS